MLSLRKFDACDYETFCGVESSDPRIAEVPSGSVMILDGCVIEMYDEAFETIRFAVFADEVTAKKTAEAILSSSQVLPVAAWETLVEAILKTM